MLKVQNEGDELKQMEVQIDLDENLYGRANMEQVAQDRVRELRKEYIDLADSQKDLLFTGSEMLETVKNVNDENKNLLVDQGYENTINPKSLF